MKKILMSLICLILLTGCGSKASKEPTLMDNPDADEIAKRIENIDGIIDVCVTDNIWDDDIATIYFRYDGVEKDIFIETDDACEEEQQGGGSVIIYESEEIALKENDYESNFDGGFTGTYHSTKGKLLFLFSNRLSEDEYKKLEKQIYDALN